jgi:hypothetical protein
MNRNSVSPIITVDSASQQQAELQTKIQWYMLGAMIDNPEMVDNEAKLCKMKLDAFMKVGFTREETISILGKK